MNNQTDKIVVHRSSLDTRSRRRRPARLYAVDYAVLGYLSITGAVFLIRGHPTRVWVLQLLLRGGLAAAIVWFARASSRRSAKSLDFLHFAYPLIVSTFFFTEVGRNANILVSFWFEPRVIALESMLFGGHPSVWLAQRISPTTLELMSFGYWSYYLLLPVASLAVFVHVRNREAMRFMALLAGTLYSAYLLFLLIPVRGPHQTILGGVPFAGNIGFFHDLVTTIQRLADISGAAFPSSHVAASWAVLFGLYRLWRRAAYLAALPVLWITVSVVFVFYHYAVDAIAGILFAGAVYGVWLLAPPRPPVDRLSRTRPRPRGQLDRSSDRSEISPVEVNRP